MRAVVTGGAGFIGSHVVDALLARGDEVHVVDNLATGRRENLNGAGPLHEHDIREPLDALFTELRPDAVVHLAAQADVGTSVELKTTCAPCARKPASPYGTSKLAAEEYLATWNRLYDAKHVALRFANVYGPRQLAKLEGGVVAIFTDRLRAGRGVTINGDGGQTRDYVYVADVVAAVVAAIGHEGGTYNVGTGVETSVVELFETLRRVAGVDGAAEHAPARPGEARRSVVDPTRAAQELGWRPARALEEGLRATWLA